jgi:DNA-binding PadR family transcriptional regulator
MPPRLVGLYALTCMERDGQVYGYSLGQRIADRTAGAWRPGPGAVYPALNRLVDRGLARVTGEGRRRVYGITAKGRHLLGRLRRERRGPAGTGPDLSVLWAEIVGAPDDSTFLLQRLRRSIDGVEAYLNREPQARVGDRSLRDHVLFELRSAEDRFGARRPPREDRRRTGRRLR